MAMLSDRHNIVVIDDEFDEITEGEEEERKEKVKSKWAAIEALVGQPQRIAVTAEDLVEHFVRRYEAMEGKAMVVCMSRRICGRRRSGWCWNRRRCCVPSGWHENQSWQACEARIGPR